MKRFSSACTRIPAASLLVFLALTGAGLSQTPPGGSEGSGITKASGEASPPAETVTIPGPLRSFLRMAAISQKVSREEVLPLLARNVVVEGYGGQGDARRPTEYLALLRRYLQQARELMALRSRDGVIRVPNCGQARLLLAVIGYQLREGCGPNTALETADPERAFLTIDSGFPLADLEDTVRGGKPFAYAYPSTQVPVLFRPSDWTSDEKGKQIDVVDTLVRDPALARLYWALAEMDANTGTVLRQSVGLKTLAPFAAVLDFYGSYIYIRSNRVMVPGGSAAEPGWKKLVGASPDSPGEFVSRLVAKDQGWLAAYFDALARVGKTQQAYFTEPRHLQRFYEALREEGPSPGAARSVYRPAPGLLLLATRLQLDPSGQPHVPGSLEVWKKAIPRKSDSKVVRDWARRAGGWNNPDQLIEGMFGLSRLNSEDGPLQAYLELSEIDRGRPPEQHLSPQTAALLAAKFPRFGNQYLIFSEFHALNDASITRFLSVAESLDRIPDRMVRADALGIFQANVGLWQILTRQGQIPTPDWNDSWQRVIGPFAHAVSAAQLFDAARSSLGELFQAAAGKRDLSQDEIVALLAGPEQTSPEGRKVRQALANEISSVLDAQRLVSLDTIFALGDGLKQMPQGKAATETLIELAGQLREFEMPKPLFTTRERTEWASGLYNNPHLQAEMQTDLAKIIKSPASYSQAAEARGLLVPFLRDSLVGLNYAYYEPPQAEMLHNNPLFVRAHDFSEEPNTKGEQAWKTPRLFGRGWAASGGAHLAGSLADLPEVLAQVEEDFIVPENVQSLIWEDLVPCLMTDAVVPRWWRVTANELHAVTLYQRFGEELVAAAAGDEQLRQKVMNILEDRLLPQRYDRLDNALRSGRGEEAVSELVPAETFYLAAQFRRRYPQEAASHGEAGQELEKLAQLYPREVSWERLSEDFGAPHPALAQTYARELLNVRPFPTFLVYSSRLLAESWDSNNLYWARLADEMGYHPVMLHLLVPELTHTMVKKIFATDLEDWPSLPRALRETGDEFRRGKMALAPPKVSASSGA
jgi:hypothetical protein